MEGYVLDLLNIEVCDCKDLIEYWDMYQHGCQVLI